MGYKLTDANGRTRNDTQWGEGVQHSAPGKGPLCSRGWIHYYPDPVLAVMMNAEHAKFQDPLLWRCRAWGRKQKKPDKYGGQHVMTTKLLALPVVTLEQKIAFGILSSLVVCHEESYVAWAENWLSGKDRSELSARAAAERAAAAEWAAEAAARAAARAAEADPTIDLVAIAHKAMRI